MHESLRRVARLFQQIVLGRIEAHRRHRCAARDAVVREVGLASPPALETSPSLSDDVASQPGITSIPFKLPLNFNRMIAAERAALRASNLIATLDLPQCSVSTAQREQSEIFHLRESLRQ